MLFQKKEAVFLSPADGEAIPLSDVPDEVFSSGMLGTGLAVDLSGDTVYSPVRGRIVNIAETSHAYTLLSEDGLDVLVHIGIDTVELRGEGFRTAVATGENVEAGAILAHVDTDHIRARGYSLITPVLISNPERLKSSTPSYGKMTGGKSEILRYKIKT